MQLLLQPSSILFQKFYGRSRVLKYEHNFDQKEGKREMRSALEFTNILTGVSSFLASPGKKTGALIRLSVKRRAHVETENGDGERAFQHNFEGEREKKRGFLSIFARGFFQGRRGSFLRFFFGRPPSLYRQKRHH